MDFHQRFGANLRQECYRFGSIAAVCRGANLNRQQFNRYLGGKAIPNAPTLKRICDFLGIADAHLFRSNDQPNERAADAEQPVDQLLASLRRTVEPSLPGGLHLIYYPMPVAANLLMRSLLVVKKSSDGRKSFTRLTVFPRDGERSNYLFKARHEGMICSNGGQHYLLGVTTASPHQMSLLSLEADGASVNNKFRCGLSLIRTTSEFISTAVCVEQLPHSTSLKAAMYSLGPVHAHDKSVDQFVPAALGGKSAGHILRSVEYHSVLTYAREWTLPARAPEFISA